MSENSLHTSFWVMMLVQTIGSVDMPGRGPRKLPAPRQYVAIVVTWLVLQVIASVGAGAARAAAAVGWVLTLTGMIVGPFGKQVVNLFATISTQYAPANSATAAAVQAAAKLSGQPTSAVSSLTPFPPTPLN